MLRACGVYFHILRNGARGCTSILCMGDTSLAKTFVVVLCLAFCCFGWTPASETALPEALLRYLRTSATRVPRVSGKEAGLFFPGIYNVLPPSTLYSTYAAWLWYLLYLLMVPTHPQSAHGPSSCFPGIYNVASPVPQCQQNAK